MVISKISKFYTIFFYLMLIAILLCCSSQVQAAQDGDNTFTVEDGKGTATMNFHNAIITGAIVNSQNGITWTNRTSGTTKDLHEVTYGNNTFVAVGHDGIILTSPDGITWTSRTSNATGMLNKVVYGNNTFVAVGAVILTSSDGVTWTNRASISLYGVTYGDNTFVAVGPEGTILTSSDGITWTSRKSGTANELKGVTYGDNTFVAVGREGTILTSPDGITWTSRTPVYPQWLAPWLSEVVYGNNTFVAVGDDTVLTSPDGLTWSRRSLDIGINLLIGLSYGNDTFVAVGTDGLVMTSSDGITWTSRASGINNQLDGITYGKNSFVAVGTVGMILQSNTFTPSQLTITTTNLGSGTVGSPYKVSLAARGGTSPYTWSATGLPVGLSINSSTGFISGTPTEEGTSTIIVTVNDSEGQSSSVNLSLNVSSQLTLNTTNLPSGTIGLPYNFTLEARGGTSPYTWSAVGLPLELIINSSTGVISGTPTTAGTSTVFITVKDSEGRSASVELSLNINDVSRGPTIANTNPVNQSQGVDPNKSITITFNKNINKGNSFKNITMKDSKGKIVKSTNTIKNDTLTLKPSSLAFSTNYTITIPSGAVKDNDGNSLENDYSFVFTTMAKPPIAPGSLKATTISSTEIDLSWKVATGCKYNVYRSDAEDSGYQLVSESLDKTSYNDINLIPNTKYWYKVSALNGDNLESDPTKLKPLKALTKVAGPANVQLYVVSSKEIDLSWDAVGGAKSYNIYSANTENGKYKKVGSSKLTSFKISKLKASTTYWYKVTAVTSTGEGDYSELVSATTNK